MLCTPRALTVALVAATALPSYGTQPAGPPRIVDVAGDANGLATVGVDTATGPNDAGADLLSAGLVLSSVETLRVDFKLSGKPVMAQGSPGARYYRFVGRAGACSFSLGFVDSYRGGGRPVPYVDAEAGCPGHNTAIPQATARVWADPDDPAHVFVDFDRRRTVTPLLGTLGPGASLTATSIDVLDHVGLVRDPLLAAAQGGDEDIITGVVLDRASGGDFTVVCTAEHQHC